MSEDNDNQNENDLIGEEVSQQVRQRLMLFLRSNSQETPPEPEPLATEEEDMNLAEEVNLEFLSDDSDVEDQPKSNSPLNS